MMRRSPKHLKDTPTDAEIRLWAALRNRRLEGYKFRRQQPLGPYVVDFCCWERRLIVEADGGQHAENARDEVRTRWLESQGWTVIRFWNPDILANTEGVKHAILEALNRPLSQREREGPAPNGAGG